MKTFTALLLGAAGLAAAVPVADPDAGNTTDISLGKRQKYDTSLCGIDTYQSVNQWATIWNLFYLNGVKQWTEDTAPPIIWCEAGKMTMVSCNNEAAIYVNVDKGTKPDRQPFDPKDIGAQMDATFHDCYGGPPAETGIIKAWQYFSHRGYNYLTQGAADCSKVGQVVGDAV